MPGGGSVPASRWPLVARDGELTALRALLVDPARRGVLVCGAAGVGKTRLAEEFLALATATGRAGGRVTGSAAAAEVPLGGLAHLLPPTIGHDRFDPVALFSTAANTFRAEAGGQPYVLLADDLPRLDATSLMLVGQLVDAGAVFLIGTVRTGEPVPPAVSALWRGGRVARIDLDELPVHGVEELLAAVLGGPVEAGTVADVYAVGQGNLLFVRELVLGALSAGRLVAEQGVWHLTGPLVSPAPLVELVEETLHAVAAPGRRVLDLLALVGAVGLTDLADMAGAELLEELEASGLIRLHVDRRGTR